MLISFFSCKKEIIEDFENNNIADIQNSETEGGMPVVFSPFPYCTENPNPIGGGAGYNNIIQPSMADIHISSPISGAAFKIMVESMTNGMLVFIDPNVSINLTGLGDPI